MWQSGRAGRPPIVPPVVLWSVNRPYSHAAAIWPSLVLAGLLARRLLSNRTSRFGEDSGALTFSASSDLVSEVPGSGHLPPVRRPL